MDILDIPEDCIYEINQHLCYVDQMAFKLALLHDVNLFFEPILKHKLSENVKDVDKFILNLINNKACISGSFILACLYDTDDYNDIDIYEYTNGDYYSNNYKGFDDLSKMQQYYYEQGYRFNEHGKFVGVIQYIRNFKYTGKNIQNIMVRQQNIIDFIDVSFDMEICKNIFDGTLKVKSWDNLINRSSHIIPTWVLLIGNRYYCSDINAFSGTFKSSLSESREFMNTIHNYDQLGFKEKILHELDELHEIRVNKYINRGYKIRKHINFDLIYDIFIDNILDVYNKHKKEGIYDGTYMNFINSNNYHKYLELI